LIVLTHILLMGDDANGRHVKPCNLDAPLDHGRS